MSVSLVGRGKDATLGFNYFMRKWKLLYRRHFFGLSWIFHTMASAPTRVGTVRYVDIRIPLNQSMPLPAMPPSLVPKLGASPSQIICLAFIIINPCQIELCFIQVRFYYFCVGRSNILHSYSMTLVHPHTSPIVLVNKA